MNYTMANSLAKIIRILYRLSVLSEQTAERIIDDITIMCLREEVEKLSKGDRDVD